VDIRISLEQSENHFCGLVQICSAVRIIHFFYYNDILLIHGSYKIFIFSFKNTTYLFKLIAFFIPVRLYNIYNSPDISFNMQLFGTIVNIYQQEIVQQKILDKIVLIKTFLVCNQKILDLKTCDLSDHIDIIAISICKQHIFQLMFIKYFKEMTS